MKKFAFIVSPLTIRELKELWHAIRLVPDFIIKPLLKDHHGFKIIPIEKVRSLSGNEIGGHFIISLPFKNDPHPQEEKIIDRVISSLHLAQKLGAGIVGLDTTSSILLNKSYLLGKKTRIPVTTGIAFASWSIFEAVYRMVKLRKANLKDLDLVIIGADSPLGSLCARKFSDNVRQVSLLTAQDLSSAISSADIIIRLDNYSGNTLNIHELKPKAIICNYNFKAQARCLRSDIAVINAGQIRLPYKEKLGIKTGLFADTVSAALAETMLLAFEQRFVSYSLDKNTNIDKLEEIADIACRHGFEVWVPEAPVL